jgi:hypothetical protein
MSAAEAEEGEERRELLQAPQKDAWRSGHACCCHGKVLQAVLLAQLLAVLLALTGERRCLLRRAPLELLPAQSTAATHTPPRGSAGIESELLAEQGINAPSFQNFINYCLLAATCGPLLLWRRAAPQAPLRLYALLALLDVEANYLVTKAYQYTFITSVTLLDCFAIPAVMVGPPPPPARHEGLRARRRLGSLQRCGPLPGERRARVSCRMDPARPSTAQTRRP